MVANVVVFGNQKGGVGKTTLSIGVAGAWIEAGKRVLLVDADPQQSASEQLGDHGTIDIAHHEGGKLNELLPQIANDYDFIIVDTPAGVNDAWLSTLAIADLLIIPVKPSPYDIIAAEKTVALAKKANTPAVFVVNEAVLRTRFAKQARGALAVYGVPILKQVIACRGAHREVAALKKSITEVELNGGKAAKEIRALAKELIRILESLSSGE